MTYFYTDFFITIACLMISLFMIGYSLLTNLQDETNQSFIYIALALILVVISDFMANLQPDISRIRYWNNVACIGQLLLPVLALRFAVSFAGFKEFLKRKTIWIFFALLVLAGFYLQAFTPWTVKHISTLEYGYSIMFGPAYIFLLLYKTLTVAAGIGVLLYAYFNATLPLVKNQIEMLLSAVIISAGLALFYDSVRIFKEMPAIPFSVPLLFGFIIIIYALSKYNLLNPESK